MHTESKLYENAKRLFEGNAKQADEWLNTPLAILGGDTPIQHSSTEAGEREVSVLIEQIENGIFS